MHPRRRAGGAAGNLREGAGHGRVRAVKSAPQFAARGAARRGPQLARRGGRKAEERGRTEIDDDGAVTERLQEGTEETASSASLFPLEADAWGNGDGVSLPRVQRTRLRERRPMGSGGGGLASVPRA